MLSCEAGAAQAKKLLAEADELRAPLLAELPQFQSWLADAQRHNARLEAARRGHVQSGIRSARAYL